MKNILSRIGGQIRNARRARGFSQAQLALRIGRDPARISELERDLKTNRMGRDRLTLIADICDALNLVPLLVPAKEAERIQRSVEDGSEPVGGHILSSFDELFVDLGADEPS